jgi:hypothetical protein
MSGGPLAKEALLDGLKAHMSVKLGIDLHNSDELEGLEIMAQAAIDYFSTSSRGAPAGAGQTLMWAIYSALWENQVNQDELNEFFSKVNVDPARMMHAWRGLSPEDKQLPHSVVLVPGSLTNADIASVTAAMFRARGD